MWTRICGRGCLACKNLARQESGLSGTRRKDYLSLQGRNITGIPVIRSVAKLSPLRTKDGKRLVVAV